MKKGYLIVLVTLMLLSLALNGVVILGLLRARQIVLATVTDARTTVIGVGDDTLSYTLEVKQEIPIVTSIPFDEDVIVPVRTTIPVSTTVVVPVNLGIPTYDLEIPIRTSGRPSLSTPPALYPSTWALPPTTWRRPSTPPSRWTWRSSCRSARQCMSPPRCHWTWTCR